MVLGSTDSMQRPAERRRCSVSDLQHQSRMFIEDVYGTGPRTVGHPSHDDRPRTPKDMIGDIAWRYLSIVDSDDLNPRTPVSFIVGDLEAALHAAFHAGRLFAKENP